MWRVLVLGILLELMACAGGTKSQRQPAPDFSLAISPTSQAVAAGGSASISLSATALNGFSSQVSVQVTGTPAGVSASPTNITLVPGTPQQITFSAAADAGTASATVTFTGTSGSLTHIAGLTLSVNGSSSSNCNGVSTVTIGSVTYTPQWCQEFNGAAGPPDTTMWSFDLGNNNGWGNNEVEAYCGPPGYPSNPSQCPTTFSAANNTVYIDGNGHLVIQPINSNGTWLSTRMKTEGLENFQYGLIEASLQIPNTTDQGLWPAFWSLGSNFATGTPWPNCGEADFMENWSPQVDGGPGPAGNRSTIHTTETDGTGIGEAYTFPSGEQANTAFHTYGVVWSANLMQFFVDDPTSPFFTVTPSDLPPGDTWPFNANIFLIMNVAVGGTLGGSTSGLTNAQPMLVDYVRWYTPSAAAAKPKSALEDPTSTVANAGAASK